MYPDIPYNGLTWPVSQHAGVLSEKVIRGLISACLLCNGSKADASIINYYLSSNNLLTENYRKDSEKGDAWRDYQQLLSEFGLIYSTTFCKEITLTPVAISFADGDISYKELLTLQVLKYQYPNGHKSQISPSLRESLPNKLKTVESVTELQSNCGILLRPVVLLWQVLYSLWQKGEQATITIDEMTTYLVRCLKNSDAEFCVHYIINSRHNNFSLEPLPRSRRNMADWIKILSQTPLFYTDLDKRSLSLSPYSIKEQDTISAICQHLCSPETFWLFTNAIDYKKQWFSFYGNIDLGTNWIPVYDTQDQPTHTNSPQDDDEFVPMVRDVSLHPYAPLNTNQKDNTSQKIVSIYDYKKSAKGYKLHDNMVNIIAQHCINKGAEVSFDRATVDLYIKYKQQEFLIEVKSTTPSNFISRLRTAIGQVHQYDYALHKSDHRIGRLGVAFTANIPNESWSIPFVRDYMDMDLLCMSSNSLRIESRFPLANELYG